jgi:hypothetical protein
MSGQLRCIDAQQTQAFGAAAYGIAVHDLRRRAGCPSDRLRIAYISEPR